MPLPQNLHAFIGAAVLGVVSAAGMFLVEHFRQERQRHAMAQDLARLDQELTAVKKELNQLLTKQKDKLKTFFGSVFLAKKIQCLGSTWSSVENDKDNENVTKVVPSYAIGLFSSRLVKTRRRVKSGSSKANSVISSTAEDYTSPNEIESSDLEFYDISDEEESSVSVREDNLDKYVLQEIDSKINDADLLTLHNLLEKLKDLCIQHPENAELLWRIGRTHHKIYERLDDTDVDGKKENIFKGVEACEAAIKCQHENPKAHKWMAILIGVKADYLPLKERILISHAIKKHINTALNYDPKDESLHHILGRLSYELANLKWYERKAAAALFGEPPSATFEEALSYFTQAESLSQRDWKANKLYIAKCEIALGHYKEALDWLDRADKIEDPTDDKCNTETSNLLEQYKGYR